MLIFNFILYSAFIGVILGVAFGFLGAFLDFCLDYGHVFGKVRLKQAKLSQKRQGLNLINLHFEKQANELGFADRINAYDSIYWQLAKNDSKFLKYVCKYCFTTRLCLAFILFIFMLFIYNSPLFFASHILISFLGLFVCTFVSIGLAFFILKIEI